MLRTLLARAARAAPQAAALPCRLQMRLLCAAAAAGDEPPSREDKPRSRRDVRPSLQAAAALREIPPDRPEDHIEHRQLEMNERIMKCATPQAVLALATENLSNFGRRNLAVALQRIASTAQQNRPAAALLQRDARLEPLLLAVQFQLDSLDPGGLSGVLSACGMLGVRPPADWLERYWSECGKKLDQFGPKELTTTLFACARLGLRPPGEWQNRFFRVSAEAMPQYDAMCFGNTLYACGQLGIMPPHAWLSTLWPACTAALPTFKPQDFSGMLYACARLKVTPPQETADAIWRESHAKLPLFQPTILSQFFYGCAALRLAPPEDWMDAMWRASAKLLQRSNGQTHANMLESAAQLDSWLVVSQLSRKGFMPPLHWQDAYFPASADRMPTYVVQDFVTTMNALGRLGIMPPREWLQTFWRCSAQKVPEFAPRSYAIMLLGCATLNVVPPDAWMSRFWPVVERKLPLFSAQDVSNFMFAVAVLSLWGVPQVPQAWGRLVAALSARDVADWRADDHVHALQMYHVYQTASLERPGLLPAPPDAVLEAARQSWASQGKSKQPRTHRGLLSDVAACLTRMGVEHSCESWCKDAERVIDVRIDDDRRPRVALMVDNFGRILRNGQPNGRTLLRNRTLQAHGWRVVSVASHAWQALPTLEEKEQYMRKLLAPQP